MFYNQNLPNNTKSTLRVTLSDFSQGINTKLSENLLPLNYAVNTFNFNFNKGSLSTGLGIKELEIPYGYGTKTLQTPTGVNKIIRCWVYIRFSTNTNSYVPLLVLYCDDNNVYYARLESLDDTFTAIDITFTDTPNGINYRLDEGDCFFLCGLNRIVKFNGDTGVTNYTSNVPSITSIALHAGRLFATVAGDENVLWFSDDLNPTNWNVSDFEGGYIELTGERGRLKKVIEANNYLYIIREFGITRLSGWGLQSDFVVKNMYLTTGKLYYNSAVLCGNTILMLCKDGLYYFDGVNMEKLDLGLDKYFEGVDNSSAVGAFLDGKYYLACKLNYNDNRTIGCESGTYTNNSLIEFDISTGEIQILRGVDIGYMTSVQARLFSKLVICLNGTDGNKLYELTREGEIGENATTKIWTSPLTDMGYPSYKKVIKYLTLNTSSDITIIFNIDGKNYEFNVLGDTTPVRIPINLTANKFSVTFECDEASCEISNPQLEVALC